MVIAHCRNFAFSSLLHPSFRYSLTSKYIDFPDCHAQAMCIHLNHLKFFCLCIYRGYWQKKNWSTICLIQVVFWCEKLWLIFRWLISPFFFFVFVLTKHFLFFSSDFLQVHTRKTVLYRNVIIWDKRDSHWRENVVYFSFYIK